MKNEIKKIAIVTYRFIYDHRIDKIGLRGVIKKDGLELYIAQGADPKWELEIGKKTKIEMTLNKMDYVYAYMGATDEYNKETVDELAKNPAENVTYVMCPCKLEEKIKMLKDIGHYGKAGIIHCECGGGNTLGDIFRKLFN